MTIYDADGNPILEVEVDDNSYRTRSIMSDNNLVLYYSLAEHVEIPVGAYCEFQGETYTLMRPEAFKMRHSRNFEYTVTMESAEAKSKVWKFRNLIDHRLKFPYTAQPSEHLQLLVDNLNARDTTLPEWSIGTCIEGDEVYIGYDHAYCYEALGQMADTFGCEFEFDCKNKTVSLWKIEHNKDNPLPLSYGKGNGFKPNVGRANYGDTPPVDILYVQGGTDNIDSSKYQGWDGSASSCLLLPAGKPTLGFDGEHFDYEDGYDPENAKTYVVDEDRYSIYNANNTNLGNPVEDSLDCSDIYPKRVGEVSEVIEVNRENHFYDFIDETIPDDLDYNDCLIDGETMTVVFQSGMLAGKEFDISKYDATEKRFEIVPQEIDGITMPDYDTNYLPVKGDKYAIFHCMLPEAYIRNDEKHEGAEWDIFREAVKYLYENEDQKFTFTGELDGIWSKKDWGNIGGRIILGGYIQFTDERFQPEGVLLRIISVKDYINKPYSPTIELSNCTVTTSFATTMKQLESQDVLIEQNQRDALQFAKRRFRDAQETITMLEAAIDSFETNFTESISPITVQTMSLLVGDESLQFRFVNNYEERQTVYPTITYADGELTCRPNGTGIIHMTLGINSISSSHRDSEYNNYFWEIMSSSTTLMVTDPDKGYYLYLKADRSRGTAEFYISDTAIAMEAETGYYYFLVGILNSEYDGDRSFVTLYGFTEILPGRITTDRIVSGDANSYMDLVNNALKLGSRLSFNINGDGQLILQGTLVQSSGSTDTSYIGCYRGTWNSSYIYFKGDEVTYTDENGVTSTYRCLDDNVTAEPTNNTFWQVTAAGVKGEKGEDGKSPAAIYQGEYDAEKTYYGNDYRLDAVHFGDQYYITRIDAGEIKGILPTNTDYWNPFGASFDSVATALLLAEWANIAGWIFRDGVLISQLGTDSNGNVCDYNTAGFTPYITLDGSTGKIYTSDGVTIGADGITLTDDQGNVVAKIVREEIGGETSLDNAEEESDHTYHSSTRDLRELNQQWTSFGIRDRETTETWVSADFDLGYFKDGDDLETVNLQLYGSVESLPLDGIHVSQAKLLLQLLVDDAVLFETYETRQNLDDFSDFQTSLGGGNLYKTAGVYKIHAEFTVTYYTDEDAGGVGQGFWIYLRTSYYFLKTGIRRTLIGTDGIYSCWGNNMYFRCAENSKGGIRMRMGDNLLRITSATNGIQKSTDGGTNWSNL